MTRRPRRCSPASGRATNARADAEHSRWRPRATEASGDDVAEPQYRHEPPLAGTRRRGAAPRPRDPAPLAELLLLPRGRTRRARAARAFRHRANAASSPRSRSRSAATPRDPALAWPASTRRLVPGGLLVDPLALVFLAGSVALGLSVLMRRGGRRRHAGFATATEVRRSLSAQAVREKAPQVRPTLTSRRGDPRELGLSLGRDVASRTPLWASLEDSFLVLGPPRSGKGVSLIIPGVLDAPGAAIVTSTRPDVLRHTAGARRRPGRGLRSARQHRLAASASAGPRSRAVRTRSPRSSADGDLLPARVSSGRRPTPISGWPRRLQ